MTKKVISTRMDSSELAKARDGLITKGIDPAQISNISQILRLTFYYGLLALCDDPKSPATSESIIFINSLMNPKKMPLPTTLNDLINNN